MTALRQRLSLVCTSAALLLAAALAYGQQGPRADPERGFAFGDTDLDGKLTFDEFRELIVYGARLKKAAPKKTQFPPEVIFRRLDSDGDGVLTVREFRRVAQLRQGGPGAFGPFAKREFRPPLGGAMPEKPEADAAPVPDRPVTAAQAKFFETKIRPVLMTQCAKCHSQSADKVKGGLLVDSRAALRRGGDTGPAIVPGNPDESLLIRAIRHDDESLRMPPKTKLPDAVVADFEAWIKMGAPDPRSDKPARAAALRTADLAKDRAFWAFQPPKAATPPPVRDAAWPKSDIDRFLLAALEAKGLKPVADADRHAWLRRVTFDLTGLPPTPDDVEAFVSDRSEKAYAKVIDRLLASARFGERWGRHWLDVARYAESSGKANMLYSQAWRYRDWVIAAFNADMPYDRFVRAQVAGDLLTAQDDHERAENTIATGFLAIGSKVHNTRDRKQFVLDLADEQIDATSQAFLGLTIACARCHDHKFDPISQRDYYALSGIFQSTQTCYGTLPGIVQNANPSPLIELPSSAREPAAVPKMTPGLRAMLEEQFEQLTDERDALLLADQFTFRGIRINAQRAMLRFRLASFRPDGTPRTYAMGVRERFEPIDSPLYARGELDQPGELVPRGLVNGISGGATPTIAHGSGRLELARWLAARDNPLTARVHVNRVWLHLFGRGLVPTPDNFGAAGQPPSHPELLDALATGFMDDGWSVKRLVRKLVLSRAYQLGSSHDAKNADVDPDNTLVWRMAPKRVEAEAIRDAMLAVSGELVLEPPVGSAVAKAGEGIVGPFRSFNYDTSDLHRAVYLPVVRDQVSESLAVFDFADPSLVTAERATTSGPSQALFLMNSPFVIRRAEAAAATLCASPGNNAARIKAAYLRFLARDPSAAEAARAREFLDTFAPPNTSGNDRDRAAWAALCQALYASAEFRYLD